MRYQYVVILKRGSDKAIDLISILLCIFSTLNFLYAQMHTSPINYFLILAAGIILAGVLYNIITARKKKDTVRYKYLLLIAGLGWIGMPYLPWLSVLFVLLTFLEYQAKYPLEIGVSGDRVVINTLIKQRHDWSAFNNIILKDGLLTLDFKSNRLIQKEVMDDEEEDADEDEFNAYCQQMLKEAERSGAK